MCILCVIQKWSRRVATMLPWLVIPLIGLWALSQLLPPAFRFEITSPRLACVLVLLVTLFWYEILMPQLSAWTARRNARLRERKRFEAIELQKLRKTAMRRCRNCLTTYKDQNPSGGKFMCSYCGHISKRPVLELPVPPGMGLSNSGILKGLGRSGKMLNGKVWSENGWMCGQDWLENGNLVGESVAGKSIYWRNGDGFFGGDDHCLAEKSYSCVFIFACKAFTAFFMSITWLWRKIFKDSSPRDHGSSDPERRSVLDKRGDNAGNGHESKGEKARRKAEEKRQARLEKELLEEEERKQREEVARLVEERRRLRDEKMNAEKERRKESPISREIDGKKEAGKKLQGRKKERDRASSKSNSDAEECEKRAGKENECIQKCENDHEEHHRTGSENVNFHGIDVGNDHKGSAISNHGKGNSGTRYFDRMKGSILSSSRAFTGGGFFGKGANVSSVSREHKLNGHVDHFQISANRRVLSQQDRASGKSYVNGDDNKNNINRPVLIDPQPRTAPEKSWQQLFTRSSAVSPPSSKNVMSRPNVKSQAEVQSSPFPGLPPSTQAFDNPINFGLSSPFSLPSFSFPSTSNGTCVPLSSESVFPRIGETPDQFSPEESEIFEDPCYVPDPVSLLGPVSESLDNFQLDRGFVGDTGLEKPCDIKNIHAPSEFSRPSPIESPMSQLHVPEERHPTSFLFPSTPKAQDMNHTLANGSSNANEARTWQMWSSSPLGPDSLGLLGGPASWFVPEELKASKKEDPLQPVAHKTMASLFSKDDQGLHGIPPQKGFHGNFQNEGSFNSMPVSAEDPWLLKNMHGPTPGSENIFSFKLNEEVAQNGRVYESPQASAAKNQFDLSTANQWAKKEWNVQGSGDGVGNSPTVRPPVGGLYSTQDVQSLWSFD